MTQQLIQLNIGSALTLDDATTPALTLTSLTNGSYRQSAKIDLLGSGFGSPNNPAQLYQVYASITFGSAPSANTNMQVWVGFSDSATAGTDNCGNCSGADGSYAGYSGGSAAVSILQLDFVGQMTLDANTGAQGDYVGSFSPRNRYCYFVVYNNSGQTLGSSSGASKLVITPMNPSLQPSA